MGHLGGLGRRPEHILAKRWEWVLLVVAEDLKHNGLALDVLDEGLGHLHRNLEGEEGKYGSYLKMFCVRESTVFWAQTAAPIPAMTSLGGVPVSAQGSL